MQPVIFIDIETIPDQTPGAKERIAAEIRPPASMSKPETIAKWEAEQRPFAIDAAWRKTALDGSRGHIAVASWAINEKPPLACYYEEWEVAERPVLADLFEQVSQALAELPRGESMRRPLIVGHNHTGFDLRFIFQRCVILGVKPPLWLPTNPRPWDTESVYDTMVQWVGPKGYARMDDICAALGIAGKGSELEGEDIDGSKVWDFVRNGEIAKVAKYCNGDVERTRAIYRRMNFIERIE